MSRLFGSRHTAPLGEKVEPFRAIAVSEQGGHARTTKPDPCDTWSIHSLETKAGDFVTRSADSTSDSLHSSPAERPLEPVQRETERARLGMGKWEFMFDTRMVELPNARHVGFNLFLVGFLILFLELACIRWFSANVIFLQFFTNIVLIASFLGMSCGCLASRQRSNWLAWFPLLALGTFVAAGAIMALYSYWGGLVVDVGHQVSPQEVFFGTEYRNPDLAQFVVPVEFIAALFFVLIALMFVGLGQVLGRAFDIYPHRVIGYSLNIGGSLVGILGFSALSFMQAPPSIWFLISCAWIVYML